MSQLQTHVEPWESNIPNPHEKVMTQLQTTQFTMGTQDSHSKLEGNVTTTKHPWHHGNQRFSIQVRR